MLYIGISSSDIGIGRSDIGIYLYPYVYCIAPLQGLCAGARLCSVNRKNTGIKIKIP